MFYVDIKVGFINFFKECEIVFFISVMGDCYIFNFGFFIEEGFYGDIVIFLFNDFDDVCVGRVYWDVFCYFILLYFV